MGFTSNCPKSDKTQKRGRKNAKWRSKVKGKKGGEFFFVTFFRKNGKAKMFMLIDNSLKHLKILICPFLATAAFYVLLF